MNRRDLIKRIGALAAVSGCTAETVAASADVNAKPALILLTAPGMISDDTAERLKQAVSDRLPETSPFHGVPIFVLGDGLQLSVLDGNGRVLNRRVRTRSVRTVKG